MIMVSIRIRVRVRIRVRADWAAEELPKHAMAAYVRVYFKLKYTGYIFDGVFYLIYFITYIFPEYFFRYILSGMFCPDTFCPVYFVWYVLSG